MSDPGSGNENHSEIARAESPAKPIPLVPVARAPDMAYQFVAQQGAIAFRSAVDHLRAVMLEGEVALAAVLFKVVEHPDKAGSYENVITDIKTAIDDAADNLKTVGEKAGAVVGNFPRN